jgi:signal transduction histidine kinase/DNA-binding response OmpR family regulator
MHEPTIAAQPIEAAAADSPRETGSGLEFRLLFEESPDVLLVLLPDAPRYTMVAATNARWRATHTTPETLGRGLFEVFPDNPDDPAASGTSNLRASLERVLKTQRPDTMPVQKYDIRKPDGTFEARYWSPKNLPILSASGEVLYILHRVEDVTDLVRASELGDELRGRTSAMEREVMQRSHELAAAVRELREANAKLAQLDRAKTEFFSNVSHEFRTPLTLMLGPLEDELAERIASPPERRVRLETAHRNAQRLLKLVNTILDFSKLEAGRAQASFAPTDLAALTRNLASVFRAAMEKAELELVVDCPELPEPVYVDHQMWEKIVFNLLSNAFKHTFEGSIRVAVRWCGSHAELSVSDTGIGIAESELPRLFERFHRITGAQSRSHEGTGIGLALVRELAALHGGELRVASTSKVGSTFTVTIRTGRSHLPADRVLTAAASGAAAATGSAYVEEALHWLPDSDAGALQILESGPAPAEGPSEASLERPRILVADDNPDMRRYVTDLLGRSYDVLAVRDGETALDAARSAPPDLVLSDVMMPGLDGFGLLKALRADERTRRLPVILLSARAGEKSAVEGLDAGADDYLVKPFTARELLARVRTHVDLARQRRAWESELERRVEERTADLAAENTRRERTERKLEAQLQRSSLLDQITRAIAERQDLQSIFQIVTRSVEENLPADVCWIGLEGLETKEVPLKNELVYHPDLTTASTPLPQALAARGLRSLVSVPLLAEGKMLGVLMAGRRKPDGFSGGECEFLRQLTEHVALAAHQAQLHESLRVAYEELRQTQRAALQQERLSALGQMASGIAHDINNAISPIAIYADSLLERESTLTANARNQLEVIRRAIDDVAQTVGRMREFYRSRESQETLIPVDLNGTVKQAIDLTRARWSDMTQQRGAAIELRTELAPALPRILGIESELRDALTNLIFNAVDAMPTGGSLTLRTSLAGPTDSKPPDSQARKLVQLEVLDTGTGMDEETRRRCLEPFFTTKGERGTGLGLAMVYGAMRRHGADLEIESAPGRGTGVKLSFAAAPASPVSDADAPPPAILAITPMRLLLVDDDPVILKSLRHILESDGHVVTVAHGGQAGIDAFLHAKNIGEPYDAVITDLGMPDVDGRKVAHAVKSAAPGTAVLMLTGWGQRPTTDAELPAHVDRFLGKPPRLRELREALAQCADLHAAR